MGGGGSGLGGGNVALPKRDVSSLFVSLLPKALAKAGITGVDDKDVVLPTEGVAGSARLTLSHSMRGAGLPPLD